MQAVLGARNAPLCPALAPFVDLEHAPLLPVGTPHQRVARPNRLTTGRSRAAAMWMTAVSTLTTMAAPSEQGPARGEAELPRDTATRLRVRRARPPATGRRRRP